MDLRDHARGFRAPQLGWFGRPPRVLMHLPLVIDQFLSPGLVIADDHFGGGKRFPCRSSPPIISKDSVNPSALWLSHPSATTTGDMPAEQPPTSWLDAAPVSLLDRHDEAPTCSTPPIPQGPCPVCPRLAQEFEPWRQAASYKAMLDRAVAREAQLHQEIARLQAQLRLREQQLFGRKADSTATAEGAARPDRTPRPRGQQRGKPGPKRRDYSHLPAIEQVVELPPEPQCWEHCGRSFASFPGTDDTTVLEVEVRAHRRISRRRRYRPTCSCSGRPGIVTAPPPAKVIPKSQYRSTILLDKFLFYRPTHRLLEDLSTQGLSLSQGTLTDGLQRLLPLFEPVYDHLVEHSQQQPLW